MILDERAVIYVWLTRTWCNLWSSFQPPSYVYWWVYGTIWWLSSSLNWKFGYFLIGVPSYLQELPVAFVTFRNRWGAALAAQSQQNSNPLLWITEMAPEPRDVLWRNLAIPFKHLPLYKIGVYTAASLLTLFFTIPVTAIQGIAKYERLKEWFPPAMAIRLMWVVLFSIFTVLVFSVYVYTSIFVHMKGDWLLWFL